jgi:hypothetical protein
MDFPDYNSRYRLIPGIDEEFAEMLRLPSFDISNPNYNPRANDGERQFQLVGPPRNVGPPDNRRSDFLMSMVNYESPNSPAASRVVPSYHLFPPQLCQEQLYLEELHGVLKQGATQIEKQEH